MFVSKNQFCDASLPCKGIFEIYFVFSHFFSEHQIAPIIPILGISVPNLVQGHLSTCYLLIWVLQLDFWETGLR